MLASLNAIIDMLLHTLLQLGACDYTQNLVPVDYDRQWLRVSLKI